MAAPNIVSVATIKGTSFAAVLTTTLTTTMVTCAAETVCKINVIRCTNVTDNDATVTFDEAPSSFPPPHVARVDPLGKLLCVILFFESSFIFQTPLKFVLSG